MIENENYDLIFKLVLIGDSGVGKTNILSRYIKNEFSIATKSTVGVEFGSKIIKKEDKTIKLQIWDTAGQERFHSITSNYFHGADGILFIYDITNINSFEGVKDWIKDSEEYDNNIQKILLGNKCDLSDSREVQKEDVEIFCNEKKIDFLETSAKTNVNLDEAFKKMVELIFKNKEIRKKLTNSKHKNSIISNNTERKNNDVRCC
jgi:small GTP-binding protein